MSRVTIFSVPALSSFLLFTIGCILFGCADALPPDKLNRRIAQKVADQGIPPLRTFAFTAMPASATDGTASDTDAQEEFIPALGHYVQSFDAFGTDTIDLGKGLVTGNLWISPSFTAVQMFPRIQRSGVAGWSLDRTTFALDQGTTFSYLGLGKVSTKLRSDRSVDIQLGNVRTYRIDPTDVEYLAQLASIYAGKQSRVYFVDTIYSTNVKAGDTQAFKAGLGLGLDTPTSYSVETSFSGERRRTSGLVGTDLIVGCKFQRLLSSINTMNRDDPQEPQQVAAALQQVLGIQASLSGQLAAEPMLIDIGVNTSTISFRSPFSLAQSERVRRNGQSWSSGASIVVPNFGWQDVQFAATTGNLFYSARVRLRITDQGFVQSDKPQLSAAQWEAFDPLSERLKRESESIADKVDRIRELAMELATDAIIVHSADEPLTRAQQAKLSSSAPFVELEREIEEIDQLPPDKVSESDKIQLQFARTVLEFVQSGKRPPDGVTTTLAQQFRSAGDMYAVSLWMQGHNDLLLARSAKEFESSTLILRKAFDAAQTDSLKMRLHNVATASHIHAGTRLAETSQSSLLSKALAAPSIELIRRRGLLLMSDSQLPVPQMDWTGHVGPNGVPSPWTKTSYFPGKGVSASVNNDSGPPVLNLKTDAGSIQINTLVNVPLDIYRHVSWDWRLLEAPPDGDCRVKATDDQGIQVVLVFLDNNNQVHALNYCWDSNAPVGTTLTREVGFPGFSFPLTYLVIESGSDPDQTWRKVRRNLSEDIATVFPGSTRLSLVASVTVQSNGQYTGATTSGEVSEILFTREALPQGRMLVPN